MYYNRSRSNVKDQGHSVEMSSDRQIIGHFQEIVVAESNDDVGISGVSWCHPGGN